MHRLACLVLLTAVLAACGRPREYVAPAPAGALECALREAQTMGYTRVAGEPDESFVRVAQRLDPPPAEERAQPEDPILGKDKVLPDYEKQERPTENQLLFREDRGRLRIRIVSVVEEELRAQPTAGAEDHAQLILAACSAP